MKQEEPAKDGGRLEEDSESRAVYQRFRRVFGDGSSRSADARKRAKREPGSSIPFGGGRDPEGLGSVMDALTARLGWNSPLAQSELLASWPQLVGTETAEHSTPVGIDEGLLTVRCDSTAWATQLRLMRVQIATEIAARYPDAGIERVRFEGPGVPSWKRGPRSIPGRGPRDTYG
ncbi:MAG: DciA family protein [Lacisediminihabitans sp.]